MRRVIPYIIERHVDEASFLWERRLRACHSPLHDLVSLREIDERLEANLEGIVHAERIGLEKATAALEDANTPAELFVAAFAAAENDDTMLLARLLVSAQQLAGGDSAIISALEWLSPARANRLLEELLDDGCSPFLQRLGIVGHVARRQDLGIRLASVCASSNELLRATAFRVVGELGRRDLLPLLRNEIRTHTHDACPWAIWSAVLMGDVDAVLYLWHIVEHGETAIAIAACDLAVRCGSALDVAARLECLSRSPTTVEAALAGAAARGDPACVPWVLDIVEHVQKHSRRAAWVYATITGAHLDAPLANRLPMKVPSDQALTELLMDPYEDLPTPDPAALRAHWQQIQSGFTPGERRLGGRIVEPLWSRECLRAGKQPWRASAAIELALGSGGVFGVNALSHMQRSLLRALTPATSSSIKPS